MMSGKKRILRGCAISLVIVIAAVMVTMIWWGKKTQTLEFTVPIPKMPTPNAHDTYIAAYNAEVNGKLIDSSFVSKTVSPAVLKQYEQVLVQNKKAFKLIEQGLKQRYYAPPVRSSTESLPYYSGFRKLARLLAFREKVMMQEKRYDEAANASLDCIQMGVQIPHGAVLIGDLVAIAIQAIGRKYLWADLQRLNAVQFHAAIMRMEQIISETYPFDKTMQQEKWTGISSLKQVFRKGYSFQSFQTSQGFISHPSKIPMPLQQMVSEIALAPYGGPDGVMRNYIRYMDQFAIYTRTRYGMHARPPILPDDPVNRMLLPGFSRIWIQDVTNDMTNQLLLTAMAIREYHHDVGHFPASLQFLVPRYLPQVAQDDFAKSGELKYKRTKNGYRLNG